MTNRELERQLHRLAQLETAQSTPAFDKAFARAMAKGRKAAAKMSPKRKAPLARRWTLVAACAAALTLAVFAAMQPPKDTRRGYVPTAELQGALAPLAADQKPSASPAPFVQMQAKMTGDTLTVTATWHNPTGDIWLATWEPMPRQDAQTWVQIRKPYPLIWLEPGATCKDAAIWKLPEGESKPASMAYSYEGYRVSADMLFWVEDLLQPTDEGYMEFGQALYAIFGDKRRLHGSETSLAYEWVEQLGLPKEVVLMMVQHLVSTRGIQFGFKEAQKLAVELKEQSVTTIDAAEQLFSRSEAAWKGTRKVLRRMGKYRAPSMDETDLFLKWTK
ncbi:MAG: hypothetical protein EOM69_10345, partial [Clostridia bacterium]|nr:hypothetical protein [Clostridia bacterium]